MVCANVGTGLAVAMAIKWSSGRRIALNNVVSEIQYMHIPELVVVRTCFDRRVRLPVRRAEVSGMSVGRSISLLRRLSRDALVEVGYVRWCSVVLGSAR